MIFRQLSLIIAKYLAISLCLITVLLTTPWGTQLTLLLLNNIDGMHFNYQSGALVRDVKLNSFHLRLDNLEISVNDLSTEIDFSCTWKKRLCIKSATADTLFLRYLSKNQEPAQLAKVNRETPQSFRMPFSIEAGSIAIGKTQLVINNTEVAIDKFSTQLSINKSEFSFFAAKAQQLIVSIAPDKQKITNANVSPKPVNSSLVLPDIDLPIALMIQQLQVDDIKVETINNQSADCQSTCQQWRSSNNQLSGTWINSHVNISEFTTSTPSFSIDGLTAEANLISPYQVNAQLTSQINTLPWWPEIAKTRQQLSMQGALNNLHFNLSSQGNLTLNSQGNINLIDKNMPFAIQIDADKVPTPVNLEKYGQYSALALQLSGDLTQQAVELTSKIKGYGYEDAQVKLSATQNKGHFSVDEFFFSDDKTNSQLDFHGDIALLADDISWQISANSTGFELPQMSMQLLAELIQDTNEIDALASTFAQQRTGRLQGRLSSKGHWKGSSWSVLLNETELSGHINNIDLAVKADIGINQLGSFKPGHLLINFNDSALTLHAAEGEFWAMKGQLRVDNISQWQQSVNGGFISNFSVTGQQDNPIIKLKTTFSELHWQQWRSNLLSVDATYQPMREHKLELTLNNDQLHWAKATKRYSVDNLLFTIDGDVNNHKVSAQWLGELAGEIALTGKFTDRFSQWHSTIEKSTMSHQFISLENNKDFDINVDIAKQEISIGSHCWLDKGLTLCLPQQATLGKYGDLAVKLSIDFSVIDQLILPQDTELISQIDGDINLKWSNQHPIEAQAALSLSSGYLKVSDEFNEHKLSQWSAGHFSFALNAEQLTSKLLLNDINNQPLVDITSTFSLLNDASFTQSELSAKVLLNEINLQPLQRIIPNVISLKGKLNADLMVKGTVESPLLNGQLSLNEGEFRIRKNANTLADISSSVTIHDNQAILDGVFFIKNKPAIFQGNLSWQDSLTMNIDLSADTLPLVFPPQLMMSISPTLNFQLVEKALTISGIIDVLTGIYNIEKLTDSSVSLSDDVILVDEQGKAVIKETSGFDIKTNIKVNIDKAFEISGQGLQSNLFGQLQITQHDKHPFQLFGRIESANGTFQAYGQKLKIEKGELAFNGPIDNPYFNLRASRHIKAEDIDVGMQVTGLADALEFTLFSSPTMEMPEMLSYLVRGRSLDAGTENSTVAASFLVGFGATNSVGLFDRIEEIPLISNIAVDTEGEGEKTQATVSGYLGNRVYLKYGIGVYEPINELTVRMFILNRFWLEIVSGIEQSTDLYYSFSID